MDNGNYSNDAPYMKSPPPPYPGMDNMDPHAPGPYQGPPISSPQQLGPDHSQPVILVQNPQTVFVMRSFGSQPSSLKCHHCNRDIVTTVTPVNGSFTWMAFGLLMLFGCWCGCCMIPFCSDGCKDMEHYCPNCQALLGTYRRM